MAAAPPPPLFCCQNDLSLRRYLKVLEQYHLYGGHDSARIIRNARHGIGFLDCFRFRCARRRIFTAETP